MEPYPLPVPLRELAPVVVAPMTPSIVLHVAGVPDNASVRVSWVLKGDYKKAADPSVIHNGRHEVRINWLTTVDLLDEHLVIDLWSPSALEEPPTIALHFGETCRMHSTGNAHRYSWHLLLAV
ncbi:MAG: hypothetical protein R3B72_37940 [Polyangiaceae bacterium]